MWAGAAAALALGCGVGLPTSGGSDEPRPPPVRLECSVPADQLFDGGVSRDAIPSLTDPRLVSAGDPEAAYVREDDRVVGIFLDGQWIAVPHNILWWHEIVNFTLSSQRLAITYCPLTGSSLVFSLGQVSRFIVSGVLFNNNLMMIDVDSESLWPQMARGARCGPRDGSGLTMLPAIEMRWSRWRELHPGTRVISDRTGSTRDYQRYPYGRYEDPDFPPLFPIPEPDDRRRPKERVLGIIEEAGSGIAFPYFELAARGAVAAVQVEVEDGPVVVLWDGDAQTAAAYWPAHAGQPLSFEIVDGRIVDRETGSEWRIDGEATAGPLAGVRLEPVARSHVAFWFAWHTFHPGTRLWEDAG